MLNIIRENLLSLQDEKFKKFHSKLCPDNKNILGVKIPILKQISKDIAKSDNIKNYLSLAKETYNKNSYYEEIMIYGLVIGFGKLTIDETLNYLEDFLPLVDNWAVCDSVCANLKITKKHYTEMFNFINKQIKTNNPFYIRFGVVMLLDFYINDEYINKIFEIINSINNNHYYVKMAIAWCLSICYIKIPDITIDYLHNCNLDNFTFNKTLQKICESKRVTDSQKQLIKNMKRNVK